MKTILINLMLATAIAFPCLSYARDVTLSAELTEYKGDGAYLAFYLTDSKGVYQKTLWMAGKKSKYYKHLRDWARGSGLRATEYDGMTGASVRSGNAFKATVQVPDTLIDAGYQIRIDSAVEDKQEHRAEVVAPLTTEGAGKTVSGAGYVKSFTYSF